MQATKKTDTFFLLFPAGGQIHWDMVDDPAALDRRLTELAAAKVTPFAMNLSAAWRGFVATVGKSPGDSFTFAEIAAIAGVKGETVQQMAKHGVLPDPSMSTGRGKGYALLWSYEEAFICGLVGTMHRHRIPWRVLAKFAAAFSDATAREKLQVREKIAAN